MRFFNLFNRIFTHPHPRKDPYFPQPISAGAVREIFSNCSDFNIRQIAVGGGDGPLVSFCYIDGLVDGEYLSQTVLKPLTELWRFPQPQSQQHCIDSILRGGVFSACAQEKTSLDQLTAALVSGFCALIFDGEAIAVVFETRSAVSRSVSEPGIEKAVKGAKDAFVERLRTNTALVRRKLCTPRLKIRQGVVGRQSETQVALVYLEDISDPTVVSELLRRLEKIDIDGLLASGNLEEYISDRPGSIFPQTLYTERPDRFAINLLDGCVGLLVDGLPLGFIVPAALPELMRVPEDAAQHYAVSSFLRFLRYLASAITVLLPGVYVAMALYHQEMLPLKLLLSILESKQQVPFGTAFEILGMLLAFEILQEAGLRLPKPVGETVGIIGALIVGQSAVEAKVVSPIAVIVVAVAGITGYTQPSQDLGAALRLCRFFLVLCGLLGGMFGIMAGTVLIVYHLSELTSFGVPYMAPLTDGGPLGIFKLLFRPPLRRDKNRSETLNTPNRRNQR